MLSTKQGGLLLLQAAGLISGAAARCVRTCPVDDPLLSLLRAEEQASNFCREFLGLQPSTVTLTVTPTAVPTIVETAYETEVVAQVDVTETTTITLAAAIPDSTSSASPIRSSLTVTLLGKRDVSVEYPSWLTTTYGTKYVSSACTCLSVAPSITTTTVIADLVNPTGIDEFDTVTGSTTTTIYSTATATVIAIATQPPEPITRVVKIQALRKDTGASAGWLYNSNGPALTSQRNGGGNFKFTIPGNAKTILHVRITMDGVAGALGFNKDSHPSNIVELEDNYGTLKFVESTLPGSQPVTVDSGKNKYESDIWTVDTETGIIGWQWVAASGQFPTISLWQVSGRLYPVGDYERFNYATSNAIGQRFEVYLKYEIVEE